MNYDESVVKKRIQAATVANRTLLLGILLFIGLSVAVGALSQSISFVELPSFVSYLMLYIPAIIGFGLVSVLYRRKYPTIINENVKAKTSFVSVMIVIVLALLAPVVLMPVSLLMNFLSSAWGISTPEGVPIPETGGELIAGLLIFALLPALVEENMFRGVVLRANVPNIGKKAIWYGGFVFGIMHMNLMSLPTLTLLGVFICLIFMYTGSLKLCVLYHFINNAFAIIVSFVTGPPIPEQTDALTAWKELFATTPTNLIFVAICIIIAFWIAMVVVFILLFKQLKNKEVIGEYTQMHQEYLMYVQEAKENKPSTKKETIVRTYDDGTRIEHKSKTKAPIVRIRVAYGCYVITVVICAIMLLMTFLASR